MLIPKQIKVESEAIIIKAGGEICDWLPELDRDMQCRDVESITRRALILNAMLQIAFKAPIDFISDWIARNDLTQDLVDSERAILSKKNDQLTEQEQIDLYWYIESLWTMAWAGQRINEIPFTEPVGNTLASVCPKLQNNEDGSQFTKHMNLR
ncbi:MAG: DUF4272 domain-containing protein, partial [Phycisphaeraceae bacterium JB051]